MSRPLCLSPRSLLEGERSTAPNFLLYSFLAVMLLSSGCGEQSSAVIDSVGVAPAIPWASLSPTVVNADTIRLGADPNPDDLLPIRLNAYARVTHPAGGGDIAVVKLAVSFQSSPTPFHVTTLNDDGVGADSLKHDQTYSGIVEFTIKRSLAGTLKAEFVAEDKQGFRSNGIILPFHIIRGNRPPVLSDLVAPDSVRLSDQTQLILLEIRVTDPDGLSDVRRVIFNSFRPDGQPSSGNPFQMYDDGTNGDRVASDGIYSLRISLPPTTAPGQYRFEFQAFDRLNAGSNIIVHRIMVLQ